MDNAGKYVTLLIIAGSFIISALNARKKAKAEQQQTEAPPKKKVTPVPQQKFAPSERRGAEQTVFSVLNPQEIEPVYSSLSESQLHSTLPNTTTSSVKQGEDSPFKINTQDLDEVKRAIIYSEIFTRRSY